MGRLNQTSFIMKAVFVFSVVIFQWSVQTSAMECFTPYTSECAETDIRCDMGTYAGCWNGDYCMPAGSVCPPVCHIPAPSNCTNGEIICDMGSTSGCWMGDYCMPAGSVCPPVCDAPAPVHCM